MRKLLLITAIVLLTTSALAGPRGLSAPPPAEPQKPFRQAEVTILPAPGEQPAATTTTESPPQSMHEKLKAAGELKPDGTPAKPAQTPAGPSGSRPGTTGAQAGAGTDDDAGAAGAEARQEARCEQIRKQRAQGPPHRRAVRDLLVIIWRSCSALSRRPIALIQPASWHQLCMAIGGPDASSGRCASVLQAQS